MKTYSHWLIHYHHFRVFIYPFISQWTHTQIRMRENAEKMRTRITLNTDAFYTVVTLAPATRALIIISLLATFSDLNLNFELLLLQCNFDVKSTGRSKIDISLTLEHTPHNIKITYLHLNFAGCCFWNFWNLWNFATTQAFINKNNL